MALTASLGLLQSLLTDRDLSLYFIPVALVIEILPHIYAILIYNRSAFRKRTLPGPEELARLARINLSHRSETLARVLRAESAYTNGRVQIMLFVVAMIAGSSLRMGNLTFNLMSATYLVSRLVSIDSEIFGKGGSTVVTKYFVDAISCCMLVLMFTVVSNKMRSLTI